ncbi:MAG: anaerobic ribonucleoside-triphosphate reductase [Candidatus Lokiarchaeota archaeon]|nr:anaerobic ribonucleoside-triphosphate reductase [Candidatus Lokiarchaeota archaeon]
MAIQSKKINITEKLLQNIFPKVKSTGGNLQDFDANKIYESLIKETGISKSNAEIVTKTVVKRIITSSINWLSGPLIREMCCSVLAELGMLEARKKYTRIGMPVMDYEKYLSKGVKENSNQFINPESIHAWAGDKISKEYSMLRLLTDEQANAHLKGEIHIHMLRYFDLRPFCQNIDLRIPLLHGLPPLNNWPHTNNFRRANHADVAADHAATFLVYLTNEFSGGLGYDNFTAIFAPIVANLSYKEKKQVAQVFICRINQVGLTRGAQRTFSSITLTPTIPKSLMDVKAVKLGGKIGPETYANYEDDCLEFFKAVHDVFLEGDENGVFYPFPKPEIKLKQKWEKDYPEAFEKTYQLTAKFGLPYFLNLDVIGDDEVHSQCCRLFNRKGEIKKYCMDPDLFEFEKNYVNLGSLQSVSLNIPRIAYESNGDDDLYFELLRKRMELSKDILLNKYEIIKNRLENNKLPLLCRTIKGSDKKFFNLSMQSLSIGFTGLNESVLFHTGEELHESSNSFEFGKRVLREMSNTCLEFSVDYKKKFSLWEQPSESTAGRIALLDLKYFPEKALVLGDVKSRNVYYTNSGHLRYDAPVSMFERIELQSQFHPIIQNGVINHLWIGENYPNWQALKKLNEKIALNSPSYYWAFTLDFTVCLKCGKNSAGIFNNCPHCGSKNLDYKARVTGYYALISQFPHSKVEEWKNGRMRYNLTYNLQK